MASVQRQPFAEVGASRLQGLVSRKNCQNAISDVLTNTTSKTIFTKPQLSSSAKKRPFTPAEDDSDVDTENQDPSAHVYKGSKCTGETPSKRLKVNVIPNAPCPARNDQSTTPTSPLFDKSLSTPNAFALNITSGANSAPAGRSPTKHKRVGILGKKRSSLSSFKRVNPPSLGSSSGTGLPFSIDAALNGTLSSSKASKPAPVQKATSSIASLTTPVAPAKVATIEESMPSGWFFDIHEDTPEEEAANLMEHSTGILDISSDDEATPLKKDDRGKENIPPLNHVTANGQLGNNAEGSTSKKHRRQDPDAMRDVGEERNPLESLNAEEYYGHGLDKTSVEIVKSDGERDGHTAETQDASIASSSTMVDSDKGAEDVTAGDENEPPAKSSPEALTAAPDELPLSMHKHLTPDNGPGFEIAVDEDCGIA